MEEEKRKRGSVSEGADGKREYRAEGTDWRERGRREGGALLGDNLLDPGRRGVNVVPRSTRGSAGDSRSGSLNFKKAVSLQSFG